MLGLILLLHFRSFEALALFWQCLGVEATPIMSAPLRSTSLSEFWGTRWNLGFRQFSHDLIFRPLQRSLGPGAAGFLVFVVSGLIHESVISLPARGGYGLPTSYFVLQGLASLWSVPSSASIWVSAEGCEAGCSPQSSPPGLRICFFIPGLFCG